MKRINTYKDFLLEKNYSPFDDTRTVPLIDDRSMLDVIKEKAPWYLDNIDNITPIYRGIWGKKYTESGEMGGEYHRMFTINPSRHKREARNTNNFYIEMMDNSPYWNGYPKRSESIICSTDENKANAYGELYRVIPLKENSKFVICPERDVFQSFPLLFKKLNELNGEYISDIPGFNSWLSMSFDFGLSPKEKGERRNVEYTKIRDGINNAINNIKKLGFIHSDNPDYRIEKGIEKIPDSLRVLAEKIMDKSITIENNDLYSELEKWMSPKDNGFKLINYNRETVLESNKNSWDGMVIDNEVYTDAECLLVREEILYGHFNAPDDPYFDKWKDPKDPY